MGLGEIEAELERGVVGEEVLRGLDDWVDMGEVALVVAEVEDDDP